MKKTESAKVLYKFNSNPDGDELTCDWNELQEEPDTLEFHFFNHAPGIVKRDKSFPSINACFFKHFIQPIMPQDSTYNKNNKTNTHKKLFSGSKV